MDLTPNRKQRLLFGVVALVMMVATVMLIQQYLGKQQDVLRRERQRLMAEFQNPVEVVIAASDLSAGQVLEAAHLTMGTIPEKFVQPYATGTARDLLGKITMAPIAEGEQMLINKVQRPDEAPKESSTLSRVTPKGKRAITIAVNQLTGVGGFVRPGDKVDILWTIKLPQEGGEQLVTLTLFQEIQVLAVGQDTVARESRTRGKTTEGRESTVTLALDPQEASLLLVARDQGMIQLSLRSLMDKGPVAIAPANLNLLLEKVLGVPPPGPPPAPTRAVEIYKGLERDVVQLVEDK